MRARPKPRRALHTKSDKDAVSIHTVSGLATFSEAKRRLHSITMELTG
jgi:hypothetical protein